MSKSRVKKNRCPRLREVVKAARTEVAHFRRVVDANPTEANRTELERAKGRLMRAKRKLNIALGTKRRHKRPHEAKPAVLELETKSTPKPKFRRMSAKMKAALEELGADWGPSTASPNTLAALERRGLAEHSVSGWRRV